jgi:DNA-binding protein
MPRTKQKKVLGEKEKATKPPKSLKSPETEPKAVKTVEPAKSAEVKPRATVNEKVVYVGQKPVKNYVMACMTSFGAGSNKIVLKARGRAICKAVDTVELLRRAFMKDAQLQGISISTEQVTREGDRKTNVSTIEISIIKS